MLANVRLRVFAYPTEDEALLEGVVARLAAGVEVRGSRADATHGGEITILEARLVKRKDIEGFFRGLGPELLAALLNSLGERLGEDGHLFFRLDKQELLLGRVRLASGGDTFVVECSAHGPRGRAAGTIRESLSSFLDGPS